MSLIRECAWCLQEQNRRPTPGATHGICKPHALAKGRADLRQWLDALETAQTSGDACEIARCQRNVQLAREYLASVERRRD